jgi:hypothetical protein
VSAIASDVAIVIAFRYCVDGLPNILLAVAASDVGVRRGSARRVFVFDMTTVMSSDATSFVYTSRMFSMTALMFSMGSGKYAEIKLLHLCAILLPAPHRQKLGNCDLCIPFVHGSYPALIHCLEFSRVNPSWWFIFRQCAGHVLDVCPSSTSNPHEKHTFQFANFLTMFECGGFGGLAA